MYIYVCLYLYIWQVVGRGCVGVKISGEALPAIDNIEVIPLTKSQLSRLFTVNVDHFNVSRRGSSALTLSMPESEGRFTHSSGHKHSPFEM